MTTEERDAALGIGRTRPGPSSGALALTLWRPSCSITSCWPSRNSMGWPREERSYDTIRFEGFCPRSQELVIGRRHIPAASRCCHRNFRYFSPATPGSSSRSIIQRKDTRTENREEVRLFQRCFSSKLSIERPLTHPEEERENFPSSLVLNQTAIARISRSWLLQTMRQCARRPR